MVAFRSFAANLVAGDTNGVDDVFARDETPPRVRDPYANAVAPSSAAIVNGSRALGAPDGRDAAIVGLLGGQATFDMGEFEEGTGDLVVSYGGLTVQWTTTVSFLDARGRAISSSPLLFTLGANQTGNVTFRGRAPYRSVRFTAGLLQAFGLDAVRATSIVNSGSARRFLMSSVPINVPPRASTRRRCVVLGVAVAAAGAGAAFAAPQAHAVDLLTCGGTVVTGYSPPLRDVPQPVTTSTRTLYQPCVNVNDLLEFRTGISEATFGPSVRSCSSRLAASPGRS